MNVNVQFLSIWLLLTLINVTWIGVLIGLMAVTASRLFKNSKPSRMYAWNLVFFCAVALSLPISAIISSKNVPSTAILAEKQRPIRSPNIESHSAVDPVVTNVDSIQPARLGKSGESPNEYALKDPTSSQSPVHAGFESARNVSQDMVEVNDRAESNQSSMLQASSGTLNWLAPWISLLYLLVCFFLLARIAASAWGCRRLSRIAIPVVTPELVRIIHNAAKSAGLRIAPIVACCERITVPVVVGLVRPLILLPCALLTEMTPAQLQAILVHEMAHLRRYDHWVICLQRVAEALLFFHPVTWWLSRKLDRQRELCCDDLVLQAGTLPADYANSLYEVARRVQSTARVPCSNSLHAAADGGRQSLLIKRIQRVLAEAPTSAGSSSGFSSSGFSSTMLMVLIPVLLIAAMLFSKLPEISRSNQNSAIVDTISESQDEPGRNSLLEGEYPKLLGIVRDHNGRPVAGATVIIQEHPYKYPGSKNADGSMRTRDDLQILARTKTAMDGEFEIDHIQVPSFQNYLDSPYPISVVILHKDHAVYWKHLQYISKRRLEFGLAEPQTLSLKLNTLEKKTLDDLRVRLLSIKTFKDWNDGSRYNQLQSNSVYEGVLTSTLGKLADEFVHQNGAVITVNRFPKDCIAVLRVEATDHESRNVYLTNIDPTLYADRLNLESGENIITSPGESSLWPIRELTIKVVDDETGEPVADALVNCFYANSNIASSTEPGKTSAEGIVSVKTGNPKSLIVLNVKPPDGSLLLGYRSNDHQVFPDDEFEVRLKTGVKLKGRVEDLESGEPIAGAPVTFDALGSASQNVTVPETTDSNGQFQIVIPIRSGRISINGSLPEYETAVFDESTTTFTPHFVEVDPDSKVDPVLKLKKLPEVRTVSHWLQATVMDQNLKPAKNVKVRFYGIRRDGACAMPPTQLTADDGKAQLSLTQTLYDYQQLFMVAIDEKNRMAGTAVFKPSEKVDGYEAVYFYIEKLQKASTNSGHPLISLEIQLQPMTSIQGTLVDSDTDEPIPFARVRLLQKPGSETNLLEDFFPTIETDEEGNYEWNLVSGYAAMAEYRHEDFIAEASFREIDLSSSFPGEKIRLSHRLVAKQASPDAATQPLKVPDTDGKTPIEAFDFLVDEFQADMANYRQAIDATNDPIEQQMINDRLLPSRPYIERMLELADANLGDAVEVKALAWACNVQVSSSENYAERYRLRSLIGDRLMKDYVDSPEIEECLTNLIYSQKNTKQAAERIIKENPSRSIQGKTKFELTQMLLRWMGKQKDFAGNNSWLVDKTDEQLEIESHKLLTDIKNNYADVPYWRHENLGNIAEMYLFELDHLGVGDPVVDIKGNDLAGVPMNLSDFRGKIVVLDFWGSWCGPCIGDLPKLNQIADDFPGDVVVIGVMNDSPADAMTAVNEHRVKWRNWVEADDGPIQTRWNIDSWPTNYVIGRDGKILAKEIRGEKLYKRIEELIRDNHKK